MQRDYKIIRVSSNDHMALDKLKAKVNELLSNNYVCVGGITVDSHNQCYLQAVVKEI